MGRSRKHQHGLPSVIDSNIDNSSQDPEAHESNSSSSNSQSLWELGIMMGL